MGCRSWLSDSGTSGTHWLRLLPAVLRRKAVSLYFFELPEVFLLLYNRVTGSLDKSLRVWSTSTWECIAVISQAHNGVCLSCGDILILVSLFQDQ